MYYRSGTGGRFVFTHQVEALLHENVMAAILKVWRQIWLQLKRIYWKNIRAILQPRYDLQRRIALGFFEEPTRRSTRTTTRWE